MASITFEGPDPTDLEKRATTTIKLDDVAMMAVVQAFCELEGYDPESGVGPGTFTIQQTVNFWMQKAIYNAERKAQAVAKEEVNKQTSALIQSIQIE